MSRLQQSLPAFVLLGRIQAHSWWVLGMGPNMQLFHLSALELNLKEYAGTN
jgi:hypothetical protein